MNSQKPTLPKQTQNACFDYESELLELLRKLPDESKQDVLKLVKAFVRVQLSR